MSGQMMIKSISTISAWSIWSNQCGNQFGQFNINDQCMVNLVKSVWTSIWSNQYQQSVDGRFGRINVDNDVSGRSMIRRKKD